MKRQFPIAVTSGMAMIILIVTAYWLFFRDASLSRLQGGEAIRIGYAIEAPYAFLKKEIIAP